MEIWSEADWGAKLEAAWKEITDAAGVPLGALLSGREQDVNLYPLRTLRELQGRHGGSPEVRGAIGNLIRLYEERADQAMGYAAAVITQYGSPADTVDRIAWQALHSALQAWNFVEQVHHTPMNEERLAGPMARRLYPHDAFADRPLLDESIPEGERIKWVQRDLECTALRIALRSLLHVKREETLEQWEQGGGI